MDNENVKNILIVLFLAIIFSLVFVIFYFIFEEIFINKSLEYIANGIAAFMGAFFAFIFLRIATFLDNIRQRNQKSFNERVFLDRYFNSSMNTINHNIYLMNSFIKSLRSGGLFLSPLSELPIRNEALVDLMEIEYINKLFIVLEDFKKLNDDIKTVNSWNNELRVSLIQGHIEQEKYKIEALGFANMISDIKIFSENLFNEKILKLIAENRIFLSRNRSILLKALNFFCVKKEISEMDINDEIRLIKREAEENMKKDRESLINMGLKL